MPTFKLTAVRTKVLQFTFEDTVEAADIHEAANLMRDQAKLEIPNDDDLIDDSVRIMARDGAGNVWDVS